MIRGSLRDRTEHTYPTVSATAHNPTFHLISGQRAQLRAASACIGLSLESEFSTQKVCVYTMSRYRPSPPRKEAEVYDKKFMKKYDEDLNTTLIFVCRAR
jgi:hypothetical protein